MKTESYLNRALYICLVKAFLPKTGKNSVAKASFYAT